MNYSTCQDGKGYRLEDGKLIRTIFLTQGEKVLGHKHVMDHVSKIVSGAVFARCPDTDFVEGQFTAPADILINKDWMHEFEALEDTTLECVFTLDERGIGATGVIL